MCFLTSYISFYFIIIITIFFVVFFFVFFSSWKKLLNLRGWQFFFFFYWNEMFFNSKKIFIKKKNSTIRWSLIGILQVIGRESWSYVPTPLDIISYQTPFCPSSFLLLLPTLNSCDYSQIWSSQVRALSEFNFVVCQFLCIRAKNHFLRLVQIGVLGSYANN